MAQVVLQAVKHADGVTAWLQGRSPSCPILDVSKKQFAAELLTFVQRECVAARVCFLQDDSTQKSEPSAASMASATYEAAFPSLAAAVTTAHTTGKGNSRRQRRITPTQVSGARRTGAGASEGQPAPLRSRNARAIHPDVDVERARLLDAQMLQRHVPEYGHSKLPSDDALRAAAPGKNGGEPGPTPVAIANLDASSSANAAASQGKQGREAVANAVVDLRVNDLDAVQTIGRLCGVVLRLRLSTTPLLHQIAWRVAFVAAHSPAAWLRGTGQPDPAAGSPPSVLTCAPHNAVACCCATLAHLSDLLVSLGDPAAGRVASAPLFARLHPDTAATLTAALTAAAAEPGEPAVTHAAAAATRPSATDGGCDTALTLDCAVAPSASQLISVPRAAEPGTSQPFVHGRDSRHRWKSPRAAALYNNREKVRDVFFKLMRDYVDSGAVETLRAGARDLGATTMLPENIPWFAELFHAQLMQATSCQPSAVATHPSLAQVDPTRLQQLERRMNQHAEPALGSEQHDPLNNVEDAGVSVHELDLPTAHRFFVIVCRAIDRHSLTLCVLRNIAQVLVQLSGVPRPAQEHAVAARILQLRHLACVFAHLLRGESSPSSDAAAAAAPAAADTSSVHTAALGFAACLLARSGSASLVDIPNVLAQAAGSPLRLLLTVSWVALVLRVVRSPDTTAAHDALAAVYHSRFIAPGDAAPSLAQLVLAAVIENVFADVAALPVSLPPQPLPDTAMQLDSSDESTVVLPASFFHACFHGTLIRVQAAVSTHIPDALTAAGASTTAASASARTGHGTADATLPSRKITPVPALAGAGRVTSDATPGLQSLQRQRQLQQWFFWEHARLAAIVDFVIAHATESLVERVVPPLQPHATDVFACCIAADAAAVFPHVPEIPPLPHLACSDAVATLEDSSFTRTAVAARSAAATADSLALRLARHLTSSPTTAEAVVALLADTQAQITLQARAVALLSQQLVPELADEVLRRCRDIVPRLAPRSASGRVLGLALSVAETMAVDSVSAAAATTLPPIVQAAAAAVVPTLRNKARRAIANAQRSSDVDGDQERASSVVDQAVPDCGDECVDDDLRGVGDGDGDDCADGGDGGSDGASRCKDVESDVVDSSVVHHDDDHDDYPVRRVAADDAARGGKASVEHVVMTWHAVTEATAQIVSQAVHKEGAAAAVQRLSQLMATLMRDTAGVIRAHAEADASDTIAAPLVLVQDRWLPVMQRAQLHEFIQHVTTLTGVLSQHRAHHAALLTLLQHLAVAVHPGVPRTVVLIAGATLPSATATAVSRVVAPLLH